MNIKRYICVLVAAVALNSVWAESYGNGKGFWKSNIEYEVNAGTNIGGASPLPLPNEIRKINSFSPDLNLQLGGQIRKWLSNDLKWGIGVGLRLETKGMRTDATVKNYGMEIYDDGKKLSGRWTGRVHTKYRSQQLVFPLTALYKLNKRVVFNLGPYLTYSFTNDFDGHVYDGYLREGDPTGDKVSFEDDARATYDFSENLRKFQWGIQGGVTWRAYKHLVVNANLEWGCNGIFEKSFKTITFSMYPIYVNFGFGYVF